MENNEVVGGKGSQNSCANVSSQREPGVHRYCPSLKPAVNGNNKIQGKDSLARGLLGDSDGNIVHVPLEA